MHTTKFISLARKAGISACLLVFGLGIVAPAFAASNEITGAYDTDKHGIDTYAYVSGASTHTVTFKVNAALATGDIIEVSFPAPEMPVKVAQTAVVDMSTTNADYGSDATTTVASTTTVTTGDKNLYRITLGDVLAGSPTWIQVTGLTTGETSSPAAGQYTVSLSTYDAAATSTIVETGVAIANVNNTVSMSAVVHEALIMTLDATLLNFSVDPSVNDGQDNTKTTTISVASNAYDGFIIKVLLNDGSTNNQLIGVNHAAALTSPGIDNYFKFTSATPAGGDGDLSDAGVIAAAAEFSGATTVYTAANNGTDVVNDGDIVVAYDLNVDFTTPADTYTGTITYTAIPAF
jgi:hypothetical protein